MNTATCSYVDTSKQDGDPDHIKVFANADAAEAWFAENDPEGVVFRYEMSQMPGLGIEDMMKYADNRPHSDRRNPIGAN